MMAGGGENGERVATIANPCFQVDLIWIKLTVSHRTVRTLPYRKDLNDPYPPN